MSCKSEQELIERAELRTTIYRIEAQSSDPTTIRASVITGIDRRELERLCRREEILSYKISGKTYIDRESLIDYLKSMEVHDGR